MKSELRKPDAGDNQQSGYLNTNKNKINRNIASRNISHEHLNKLEHRNYLLHKQASKPGLRGKINAKCIECIYDPYSEGTWRNQVINCTSFKCPLYEVRATSTMSKL